ncbi:MAG: AAA family ATPase [Microcoleus vaginatus WJT46-NPBG5]|jgi:capsular exopolysaccharide synthesis family protein|nr:AAA family ATPase [Microcoleus vaginatus WJT46-NPBG5]
MTPPIVKRYLIAVGKYKWFGVAAFVAVCGASGVVAIQPDPAPIYLADGLLTSNRPLVAFAKTTPQIQEQGSTITQEFLLSPEVIQSVSTQMKESPNNIQKNTKIWLPKEGAPPFIQIQYLAPDQDKAKAMVAALMKAMVEYSNKVNSTRVDVTVQEIQKRLVPVTEALKAAEQELEQFDRIEGAALSVARIGALPSAIATSQEQQRQLRLAIEGTEAQIRSLSSRLGLTPDQAYVSQALSADPILANLRVQMHATESEMEILKRDLRDDHPRMVELRRKQQAYEELLRQRSAEVIGGNGAAAPLMSGSEIRQNSSLDPARQQVAGSLMGLQTERDRLQQQFEASVRTEQELRNEYASIPNKQLERDRRQQQVAIHKALYDQMQTLLADTRTAGAETVSSLSIAPQGIKVARHNKPGMGIVMTLAAGAVVGIFSGGVLIFLLSMLDGKFYTMEEVRGSLQERDVPLLGILPAVMVFDLDSHEMPVMVESDSPYLEFYERLRTNLRRVSDKPVKVLLLTSVGRKEGKTFCAYNLAIASARAGKRTLLIEADLRSPSQAQCLKVATDPENSIEPLRYYGQPNSCIRLVPEIENLYVVPSPGPVRQPGGILESSELQRLLKDVRGRFDFVIVDTPALSACNDALLLEPHTDGMVVVARPLFTESGLMTEYVDLLTESEEIQLLGAIINGADTTVEVYSTAPFPEPADYLPVSGPQSPQDARKPQRPQAEVHNVRNFK